MKLLLAFATAALLAGCSTAQSATDTPVTMADITELIGKPEAQSIDSCKVLPIGKKACGGPASYVVYSSETITDERELLDAVHRYNKKAEKDAQTGYSTCQFIPEPEPQLKGGVCWIP
ncbi:hypothetical protein V6D52_12185 [Idiomarina loihiensis]|jgi:hypothetical protein|uniref:hypothetical protein n=1 Tax=Idiomarina TaxID=135575 RepID=UPI00031D7662|nr:MULTISPECIES: hypothetical protein [unclassified Idiomarina]NWO01488.1 hypothetical protein [Idiomarinaceae bacterium]HAS22482.1 hypothetical protein [Idiomarina loihiensis]|tara:strand:- start:948 stop:1301 length:354 start_codon:yes stop_codon:yes gene_type:complete